MDLHPPSIRLPGCKSLSQRALILAATARGRSRLVGISDCEDSLHLQTALAALGATFESADDALLVTGIGGPPRGDGVHLDVGEAGSSLRFLLALCAAGEGCFRITGTPRLLSRPQGPLVDFLRERGCRLMEIEVDRRPGFEVHTTGLPGGEWQVPVASSSQFLSGLVMAAAWSGGVTMALPAAIPSRGYFDLTLDMARRFRGEGSVVEEALAGGGFRLVVSPGDASAVTSLEILGDPSALTGLEIPGDPSAATFFLVALALTRGSARLQPPWSDRHPEACLFSFFTDHGLLRRDGDLWSAADDLPPQRLEVDLDAAPDAGPALAVLGAFLPGGLILNGIDRLRLKESDRVAGMQRLVEICGSSSQIIEDRLQINGAAAAQISPDQPHFFDPDQDHRLAMAAGIASLRQPHIEVSDPECVAKSFPAFWSELASLVNR